MHNVQLPVSFTVYLLNSQTPYLMQIHVLNAQCLQNTQSTHTMPVPEAQ